MKSSTCFGVAFLLAAFCLSATAQTVTPLSGQSSATTQQDSAACQALADSESSAITESPESGGRARGAAIGLAVGAAPAGAAIAGVRKRRHERAAQSQAKAAAASAYANCMQQRGYQVTP
ncbi:hypothetical protein D9M68_859210 [compost metagenome]